MDRRRSPYEIVPPMLRTRPNRVKTSKVVPLVTDVKKPANNRRRNNRNSQANENAKKTNLMIRKSQQEILALKSLITPLQFRLETMEKLLYTQTALIEELVEDVLVPKWKNQRARNHWKKTKDAMRALAAFKRY